MWHILNMMTEVKKKLKKIRKLLVGLPKNVLFMYAFSLSKSLSIYGMRIGAQICSFI